MWSSAAMNPENVDIIEFNHVAMIVQNVDGLRERLASNVENDK